MLKCCSFSNDFHQILTDLSLARCEILLSQRISHTKRMGKQNETTSIGKEEIRESVGIKMERENGERDEGRENMEQKIAEREAGRDIVK